METNKASKYYKMYKDAFDYHSSKFDEYTEMVAYFELEQNELVSMHKKPWVYQINTPFATDAINIRVASLQANDYTGELEPLSPDDIESVNILNKVYLEQWLEMNMDKVIDDAILQSAVVGEAYVHIVFDSEEVKGGTGRKNTGKLESYFIDAASVHIDPKALNLQTADYVAISERITRKNIELEYPDFNIGDLQPADSPQDRGEIYFGKEYNTEQDSDVFNKVTIYERVKGGIEKTVLVERKILVDTEIMPIRTLPIAQMLWQKKLKSPYGTSLMAMLLPLQKVLNEIESANANANMQYSSPSYLISEDSGIDPAEFAASAGAPGVAYLVSSGIPLGEAISPLISQRGIDDGLVTTKQELERSIYKLAGITEQFMGNIGTAGNTSTGSDMAVQRAKSIEQRILTNIEEFVEDLTSIIVEFVVQGYAGEKLYARGEKQTTGDWEFEEYEVPENAEEIEYNFSIELNVRTNYSKEQQKQMLTEVWQMERQYGDDEIKAINTLDLLKVQNIPQREEIVERYEKGINMDSESKAQLISEMTLLARELGIDAELLNAAIAELIRGDRETPAMDEFMQTADQLRQQANQMDEQMAMEGAQAESMASQMGEPQQGGDDQMMQMMQMMQQGGGQPDIGDMEFGTEEGGEAPGNIEDMEFGT